MGRHPMGEGADPNPRFLADKLVVPRRAVDGRDRGEPARPVPAHHPGARRRATPLRSQEKVAKAYAEGKIQPDLVPVATRSAEQGWGLATKDEPPRPDTTLDDLAGAEDAVPAARPGHRRQRRRPQRRGDRLHPGQRRRRRRARPAGQDAAGRLRLRRRGPRGDGCRPDPLDRAGAGQHRAVHRRHRPVRAERGVRRAGAGLPRPLRHRRRRPPGQPVRRRHRPRPPAGLLRRPADDPAGPAVRRAPRGALRPDRDVRRVRPGRLGDLGEPALQRGSTDPNGAQQ